MMNLIMKNIDIKKIQKINTIDRSLWRSIVFLEKLEKIYNEWLIIQKEIEMIDKYYSSKEYMKDLQIANNNWFPHNVRLWAFSEDWIWNMLWDHYQLTKEINKLTSKILRKYK